MGSKWIFPFLFLEDSCKWKARTLRKIEAVCLPFWLCCSFSYLGMVNDSFVWGYTNIFTTVNDIKWTMEQTMVGWISRWRVWTWKEEKTGRVCEEVKHVENDVRWLCGVNRQLCPYSLSLYSRVKNSFMEQRRTRIDNPICGHQAGVLPLDMRIENPIGGQRNY